MQNSKRLPQELFSTIQPHYVTLYVRPKVPIIPEIFTVISESKDNVHFVSPQISKFPTSCIYGLAVHNELNWTRDTEFSIFFIFTSIKDVTPWSAPLFGIKMTKLFFSSTFPCNCRENEFGQFDEVCRPAQRTVTHSPIWTLQFCGLPSKVNCTKCFITRNNLSQTRTELVKLAEIWTVWTLLKPFLCHQLFLDRQRNIWLWLQLQLSVD